MTLKVCISDANAVQHLWRLNTSDPSWLKGLVALILPDVVENELNGRGRRKPFGGRSAPGRDALVALREWGIVELKAWPTLEEDAEQAKRLMAQYRLDDGEAFALALAAKSTFPLLIEDGAGRRAAKEVLGTERVLSGLDLVWWAANAGRIDRRWLEAAAGRLAPHFRGADQWPDAIAGYAEKAGIDW